MGQGIRGTVQGNILVATGVWFCNKVVAEKIEFPAFRSSSTNSSYKIFQLANWVNYARLTEALVVCRGAGALERM